VFAMDRVGNLRKVACGDDVGTLVGSGPTEMA